MSIAVRGALFIILVACVAAIVLRRPSASTDANGWVKSGDGKLTMLVPGKSSPPIGSIEGDLQVLAQLRKAGADLTKPTEVNYYMYFPDSVTADHAADSTRTLTWEAEVRSGQGRTQWLCLATTTMVPDRVAILEATKRFVSITKSLGGDYDGWEAAVTK